MTITYEKIIGGKRYIEGFCESSESKPTDNICAGILTETDTGKAYFFNGTAETWVEQFSFQS